LMWESGQAVMHAPHTVHSPVSITLASKSSYLGICSYPARGLVNQAILPDIATGCQTHLGSDAHHSTSVGRNSTFDTHSKACPGISCSQELHPTTRILKVIHRPRLHRWMFCTTHRKLFALFQLPAGFHLSYLFFSQLSFE